MINEDITYGFISGAEIQGHDFLRLCISNHTTTEQHLDAFFRHIVSLAQVIDNKIKQVQN